MPKYIFTGDILHAGRVEVEAATQQEAYAKLDLNDFVIYDEDHKWLGFTDGGEPPEVIEEEPCFSPDERTTD